MKVVFNVNGKNVPLKSLQYISKANQLEVMRDWFFDNFEDPANSCPYESKEGGYAYIYGGPYEASEELQAMFEGYVKFDYIQELADELQDQCYEWSGNSQNVSDWYDEDLYDAVTSSEDPFEKFVRNIEGIKSIAQTEQNNKHKNHLLGILYTNVITALETLYVELFINSIDKDDSYISDFIEKGKTEFKVSKEILSLTFKGEAIEKIKEEIIKSIKEHLISVSWHSTRKVISRYKATFDINVQKEWPIDAIEIATQKRNHLVHRGGKDKDGNVVLIAENDLDMLLDHAKTIGENLSNSLMIVLQEKIEIEF